MGKNLSSLNLHVNRIHDVVSRKPYKSGKLVSYSESYSADWQVGSRKVKGMLERTSRTVSELIDDSLTE